MKKIKHSKIKNTGILFELLVRQVTADVLNDGKKSIVVKLLKRYFSNTKPLGKEITLYNSLMKETFNSETRAKSLISEVIKMRNRITNKSLRTEKYNLIKEIRSTFPLDDFFNNKIQNYKLLASIYKLFESETSALDYDPSEIVRSRYTIIEHICSSKKLKKPTKSKVLKEYDKSDRDLKLLAYKILVDNFNSKYKNLNTPQKKLLKEFINNISNTNSLKDHIVSEKEKVKKQLKTLIPKITDKVTKIKVKEAHNSLDQLTVAKGKVAKEKDVLTLMRYYELVKELKRVNNNIKEKILTNG